MLPFAVTDALRRGDYPAALRLADQSVGAATNDADLLTLAGQWRIETGRFGEAVDVFARARALAPGHLEALDGLGIALTLSGRAREAVAVFDDGLKLSPGALHFILHRAHPLEDAGRLKEAQAALEQVLAAQPDNLRALDRLANLCARRGDMVAARRHATRALAIAPVASATIALATAEIAEGNFDGALRLLSPIAVDAQADPVNRSIAQGLMGDALDGLGRYGEAFAAYAGARELLRDTAAPSDSAIARVHRAAEYFRGAAPADWRAEAVSPVKTHVFLVGFPRSGTTLMEQALAGHPDVRAMEEIDCLAEAAGRFFYAENGLQEFAQLSDAELDALRARYWQAVDASGVLHDRAVFVDKLPLNSVHQGFIAKLFPSAKILFALRDPRDVVLSCFRRRLVLTSATQELSRLDGAAGFYDAVMEISEVYRTLLPLPRLDLRHEDMLADFDGEMARLCDFLGLAFDPAMRDVAATAKARDVKTPSAAQVSRGLNKDGAGQWRHYAKQLAPVLPVLQPWVQRFGYAESPSP
jgi:tetratricopeptide (TPR) repeat protein